MKIEGSVSNILLALISSTFWLVACGSSATPTETSRPRLLIETPTPLTSGSPTPLAPVVGPAQDPVATQESTESSLEPAPPTIAPTPTAALPTSPPVTGANTAPASSSLIQHTVQAGETLFGIAIDYGVSMAAIQLANKMGNSIDLLAGQTLSVPGSAQWLGERPFWTVHVVQRGETLVGLSDTYDLSVDEILRVNAIADPELIRVDQQLVMPLTQLVTLKAPQPTATPVIIAAAPTPTIALAAPELDTSPQMASATIETPTPEPQPTAVPPPSMPSGPTDWPTYILTRINQARTEHGLNTLTVVPELNYAAQAHAEDCVRRGWGSHVGSDGAVLNTRLERAGYFGLNWGENWVQALDAKRAFEWWYGEIPPNDPHRRNILSPRYTEIGIGIAETGWGYIFITDFGRR